MRARADQATWEQPGWQNTTVLRGDVLDEVQALKARPGRDIVATGSIHLVRALPAAGLVDEIRLFVFPVVVGSGQQLFPSTAAGSWHLLEARAFASGPVLLRYATA